MRALATTTFLFTLSAVSFAQSGNFESRAVPPGLSGFWNDVTSWTQVSGTDADGLPDADDHVTILTGHTIFVNVNSACADLTLLGTGQLNFNLDTRTLTVNGTMEMRGNSTVVGGGANRILNLLGNFLINSGQIGSIGDVTVTQAAAANFTILGEFRPTGTGGTKTLGNVRINSGGTNSGRWNYTVAEPFVVQTLTLFDGPPGESTLDGAATATITVVGSFTVNPTLTGYQSRLANVSITVNGTTTVNGYLIFTVSGSGNKIFNNTITVNPGGTWDNIIGEDPDINCSIVNNGNWPPPTGGLCRYRVTAPGTYTYTGANPINFGRLRVDQGTVTNLTTLVLLGDASLGLRVNTSGVFNNGDGVVPAQLRFLATGDVADLLGVGATINFSNANSTVEYVATGNQNIYPTTYHNLISNSSGTKSQTGDVTVNNSLTLGGSVVYNTGNFQLAGAANLAMSGTSELQFGRTGVNLPELTGTSNTLGSSSTITLSGTAAQTLKSNSLYPYQNLRINGGAGSAVNLSNVASVASNITLSSVGAITAISSTGLTVGGTFSSTSTGTTTISAGAGNLTVGSISLTSGVFDYSGKTVTINGTGGAWINNGVTLTDNAASTVRFQSGANQLLGGTSGTTFRNLVIDNANGLTLSGTVNQTCNTDLNLVNGALITGAQRIIASGTVTRTNGFVNGNLQKPVTTGTNITRQFEVGTGSTYSPVTVVFASITAAGTGFLVSSTAGDHPDILSANIEPNFSVNRFYTFTNLGPITFTTLRATLQFDPTDVDGGFLPATQAAVRGFNGTSWFALNIGTRTATQTEITGAASTLFPANAARSLQIGRRIITSGFFNRLTGTRNWHDATTWINNRAGTITLTNGSSLVTGAGTSFLSELVNGDLLVLQSAAGAAPFEVLSRTDDDELTLTAPYTGATTTGGYGRLRIPNSTVDSVSIGNTLIADALTTITLDANATVNTLNIGNTGRVTAQSVVQNPSTQLTITANASIIQPGGNVTNLWDIGSSSASVAGNLTLASAANFSSRIARVQLSSGTLQVSGNLIFNTAGAGGNEATAVLSLGANGRINLAGSLLYTNNRGTLSMNATSVFNFNRTAGAQDLDFPNSSTAAFVFSNIECNNTSTNGVRVIENVTATNVTGNLRVLSGKLQMVAAGNPTIVGSGTQTFEVSDGATLEMLGNGSQLFPQSFGTYALANNSHVIFAQTGALTMPLNPTSYGNLSFRGGVTYSITNPTFTINGDLTIGTGSSATTLTGSGTTTLQLKRNFVLNAAATFNATNIPSITLDGNWTSSGTFTAGSGSNFVEFSGITSSQPQVIGGTSADTFFNLRLVTNDDTDRVRMDKGISISNQLTLTRGGLDLNGNRLSITNPVTSAISRTAPGFIRSETNGSPYSRIRWTVNTATGAFVFPFGLSDAVADYIPFTFNITAAGAPSGTVELATYPTAANNTPYPTGVTNMNGGGDNNGGQVVDRFWIITPAGFGTTSPTATLTFTCTATERAAVTGNLRAHRWNPANYWDGTIVGQSNPTTNSSQVPGVTSFSPWTLASESAPLPIQLVSFEVALFDRGVKLTWRTAQELRNDFFDLERSGDGEVFVKIATVPGAGNSNEERSYEVIDSNPLTGVSYYRLKQTDWDGAFSYSNVAKVHSNRESIVQVFPNPVLGNQDLQIRPVQQRIDDFFDIRIISPTGAQAANFRVRQIPGEQDIRISHGLAPGIYVVEVYGMQGVARQKLIVR